MRDTFVSHQYEKRLGDNRRRRVDVNATPLEEVRDDFSQFPFLANPLEELYRTGFFYPHHKVIRKVRNYIPRSSPTPCRKDARKGTQLGDGTFFLFCLDCRYCLGFHLMHEAEGPKTVCMHFVFILNLSILILT